MRKKCRVFADGNSRVSAGVEILRASFSDALRMTGVRRVWMVLTWVSILFSGAANGQVTAERLRDAAKEPQNWLMYSGDYAGRRYSTLEQINTSNAARLVPKWVYQTMACGTFETKPLVVDGLP